MLKFLKDIVLTLEKYSLFGIHICHRKIDGDNMRLYFLGFPVYSRKRINGVLKKRIFFIKYSQPLSCNLKVTNDLPTTANAMSLFTIREDIDSLFMRLCSYEVVSLDIFDTALLRKVEFPEDVFRLIAMQMGWPEFAEARKRAEAQARYLKEKTHGHREITIGEIYDILEKNYGVSRKWQDRECELEIQLSVVNPYIYELYQRLINNGITVIFCSDMYLPSQTISKMLRRNGYHNYSHLYVSNEYNLRKGDGKLQKKIILDFPGKRIAHIGDNKSSDKQKSDDAGITGIWNPDCRLFYREGFLTNLSGSLYRAVICNNLNNGTWQHGLHYTHGFRVGGILAAGYSEFIHDVVKKEKIDKILFCGRDCFIIEKVYKTFFKDDAPPFFCTYAEISRYAAMNLSPERYAHDLLHRFIFRYWDENKSSKTVGQVLEDLGYSFLLKYLDAYDIEQFQFCDSIKKERFEAFFMDQIPELSKHAKNSQRAAVTYFRELLGNSKRILVADIGWSGTCITALKYFLQKHVDADIQVIGALLFSSNTVNATNNQLTQQIYTYIATPAKNSDLLRVMFPPNQKDVNKRDYLHMPLEYLFTSPEASLLGYEMEAGKVVLLRDSNLPTNLEEIQEMQEGMMHFCKLFFEYRKDYSICPKISPYVAFEPLRNTLKDKVYCQAVYKNFLYDACTAPNAKNRRNKLFDDFFDHKKKQIISKNTANRILFVTPELIYTGAPRSLIRVCKIARTLGYEPIVWSMREGPFRKEFKKEGIPVSLVSSKEISQESNIALIKSCKMAYCNTIVTDEYAQFIKKYIPTIWFIREASNIPDFCRNNKKRLRTLKTFPHLYCVSSYAAESIAKYTTQPIHVLENCVEDEIDLTSNYVTGTGDKVRFVQFGTMEFRKGYDVLLAAYKMMPEAYRKKAELYFAGGFINSGTPFCSYLFSEMKKVDGVHYLGLIQGEDQKVNTLSTMDVIVVASRDESCSLVALEGAMLSKPLIVTENVGAKYMVTPDNGVITKTDDVHSLKDALMLMIDNRAKLAEMGKKSRQLYEKLASMDKQVSDLRILFNSLSEADQRFLVKTKKDRKLKKYNFLERSLQNFEKIVFKKNDQEVLISLTSHPGRIKTITPCIKSLINQDWSNKKIILWLSKEQFPEQGLNLPNALLKLVKKDLFEIRWVDDDIKPHKKYFYVMQEYPNTPVITVDDDVIYKRNMVSILMNAYKHYPKCVICHRANLIAFKENGEFRSYAAWRLDYKLMKNIPTSLLLPTGVGGVLYPPGSVPSVAFNKEAICSTCLYTDDLWLKLMCTLNGFPTLNPSNSVTPQLIDGSQEVALWKININADNNDISLHKIVSYMKEYIPGTEEMLHNFRKGHFR